MSKRGFLAAAVIVVELVFWLSVPVLPALARRGFFSDWPWLPGVCAMVAGVAGVVGAFWVLWLAVVRDVDESRVAWRRLMCCHGALVVALCSWVVVDGFLDVLSVTG